MTTAIAIAVLVLGGVAILSGITQFFQWMQRKLGGDK